MGFFSSKKTNQETAPALQSETSLFNPTKALLMQRLEDVLSQDKGKGVVMKLYLENFKTLNDMFGHDFGERLLEEIYAFLCEQSQGPVYRYIGVEFVMILEKTSYGRAADLADQLLERFGDAWRIDATDCMCSAHIGMCVYPGHCEHADQMMKMLDYAVAEAVEIGPNTMAVYDDRLHARVIRRRCITAALQDAVENDRFEFFYRPTFCLSENRYTRAEAYIRLFIPDIGNVAMTEFMPVAEDSGQAVAFEYYAIEKVCQNIRELLDSGKDFESIAIPVSAVLFFQRDMIDRVQELMEAYQIPEKKLGFEITEGVLTTAYLSVNVMMQELADIGVEIILNDFGSGYSGVSNILTVPVDVLKLERMFVWQLEISEQSGYLIEGLIGMAKKLGLKLIAEGVETDMQIQKLKEYGCTYEQGFYYSPTVEKAKLFEMLADVPLPERENAAGQETADMK